MPVIKTTLEDRIYKTLCVLGEINRRSPEAQAEAILSRVCEENMTVISFNDDLPRIHKLRDITQGKHGVAVHVCYQPSLFLDVENNTGHVNYLVMSPYGLKEDDTVVIYKDGRQNIIYEACITKLSKHPPSSYPRTRDRYDIHFKNWKKVGIAVNDWKIFAKTGAGTVVSQF